MLHHFFFRYTSKEDADSGALAVYAITLNWPPSGNLILASVEPAADLTITMLGYPGQIKWTERPEGGISVLMPQLSDDKMPCHWAWSFKLLNVA